MTPLALLIYVTDVPSSGNDPHHLGPSLDGKTLVGVPISILKPSLGIRRAITLRLWDLDLKKRLDDPDEDQPTIGPHYVKVTPDQKHLLVTDYFVQTGEIGLINTPADFKALYIDINDDGSLSFNRSIDFSREFANRGGAKPHFTVVFDFTDPENPLYY
ncbi:hypothetical protein BDW72DRAFT_192643 [Aspergillus terricola var. indicus]